MVTQRCALFSFVPHVYLPVIHPDESMEYTYD